MRIPSWLRRDPRKSWLFPELGMFDSAEEARSAIKAAWCEHSWEPESVLLLPVYLVGITLWKVFSWTVGPIPMLEHIPAGAIAGAALAFIPYRILRVKLRQSLRRLLNEQGKPTCMACGYNLCGNVSGTCPECAKPVPGDSEGDGSQEWGTFR